MLPCAENIWPDAFSGAIFALEGIKDAVVILNGPTGCKFYHSAISDYQYPRDLSYDPLNYPEIYYFGQPRVPATFLDGDDYVHGATIKLAKIMQRVASKPQYNLVAVVNSPGAALIGDDLERLVRAHIPHKHCICIESTGFSGLFAEGFQNAFLQLLPQLNPPPLTNAVLSVNLVGLSIYHKHYQGSLQELRRLLSMCGIQVKATFCCGSSLNELQGFNQADLNVVLYPEYGLELCRWMQDHYKVPYVVPAAGLPLGFDNTAKWITEICTILGADSGPAQQDIEAARARAFLHLSRYNSVTGLPQGAAFAIKAESSLACALAVWLHSYLGMIPTAVELLPGGHSDHSRELKDYLSKHGLQTTLSMPVMKSAADVIIADGNTLAQAQLLNGKPCCGIEIALPSLGYLDVVDKSLFGVTGAMLLIEQILNGLRFVCC